MRTISSADNPLAQSTAGTGRLLSGLTRNVSRIVFGATADADIDRDLPYITMIDEAHLLMLAECDLIRRDEAARLLTEIHALRSGGFAALRECHAPRGLYLLYEDYLIQTLGPEIGGILQTGRSRNDLKATMHQLRMRDLATTLVSRLLRLQAVLLGRARAYRGLVMPAYSQFQPAVPATYGYYLLGVATALDRDILGFTQACAGLRQCPLGAAGGAGTDIALDPARTAALLGFSEPVRHAGDAIATRDTLLRPMSAGVMVGLTLSRLATDLQLWSTQEFDLIGFPDELVGSSSAMPQKRNPFLLEHIKGGSGAMVGGWTCAVTNIKNTPFSNSVEVTTEAVAPIWSGLARLDEIAQLATCVVAGARPKQEAMSRSAARGYTVATALANKLVAQGVPFRSAHRAVGRLTTELVAEGVNALADVAASEIVTMLDRILRADGVHAAVTLRSTDLDPATVAAATVFGGGPGRESFQAEHARLTDAWREHVRAAMARSARLRTAEENRRRAVSALIGTKTGAGMPT